MTWRGGGPAINVFVSDDPIDAGTDVRAPDGPNQVTVPRREQTYVHLFDPEHGFTVVGERLLAMDGVMNFRDLGGYPTVDGGATRWGQVFRSARLNETSDADLDRIERLGITKVFDLRTQAEVDNEPDRLPDSVEHVHLPMSSSVASARGAHRRLHQDADRRGHRPRPVRPRCDARFPAAGHADDDRLAARSMGWHGWLCRLPRPRHWPSGGSPRQSAFRPALTSSPATGSPVSVAEDP
ncbi:MAG: tyrosine-protein phosphatase [Actinobacteria bacterium]|nr:tyrosine-protein phosphatase [Actinomycetota bacterium]